MQLQLKNCAILRKTLLKSNNKNQPNAKLEKTKLDDKMFCSFQTDEPNSTKNCTPIIWSDYYVWEKGIH